MDLHSSLGGLRSAQAGLRSRFDDFRRALGRRDVEAYSFGLADFLRWLRRWTNAQENALLPALLRARVPGRDPQRELRLEWVQLRELTRYLQLQIAEHAPMADIEGLAENLDRRLTAHEAELDRVYYPAAAEELTGQEWNALGESAPD